MPIRWKKTTRCTRLSQLVADHLQSQRRGGSLVVETGFPTSLIDIYIRNRGRLRKFSGKKQRGNDSSNPVPSSSDSLIESNNSSSVASGYRENDVIIEESVTADVDVDVDVDVIGSLSEIEEIGVEIAYSNRVLVAALKVLLMAVLALGTKRFTIGITVLAFLLLFLEYLGRLRLLKPCWDPRKLLQSSFQGTEKTTCSESNSTPALCNEVLEIEEEEEEVADSVICEVLLEIRHKKSRRAKMKSKILKLLPKKFRTSKNCCLDSKGKIPCGFKEEGTLEQYHDLKSHMSPLLSNECLDSNGGSKEQHDKVVGEERTLNLSNGSDDDDDEELGRGMQSNSGYLVLCLVVLVGLIGGRISALVLAIYWCLMLKMTQWRHVKLPIS